MGFDIERVRADFPYLDERIYLNTASTGIARRGAGQGVARFFDDMYSRGFDGRDLWRSVADEVRGQIGRLAHVPPQDEDIGAGSGTAMAAAPSAEITRIASRGYLRGRSMTVVTGGAARRLDEDNDPHHPGFGGGDAFEPGNDTGMLDISAIGASVQAELGNGVSVQMAALEASITGGRDVRAQRAAEARMKGFEGDSCGSCGNFTLVRNGPCMKCNTCGSTTGCS